MELPFKNETATKLDIKLSTASRRFTLLKKCFFKNDLLKNDYCAFIKDFVHIGPEDELVQFPGHVAYLPHQAVFKQSSTLQPKLELFLTALQKSKLSL